MKILKYMMIVCIITIFIAIVGSFIAYKTIDINKFKSNISSQIGDILSSNVSMDNIRWKISFVKGISLDIRDLVIARNKSKILTIDEINLNADIISFILKRKIVFTKVRILSPVFYLVRGKDGSFNILSVKNSGVTISKKNKKGYSKEINKLKSDGNIDIAFNLISVENGSMVFVDNVANFLSNVSINAISFDISNFSLDKYFSFRLSGDIFSDKSNINLKGKAKISRANKQIRLDDVDFNTDLSSINPIKLVDSFPDISDFVYPDGLRGQLKVNLDQMIFGIEGLNVLSLNIELSNGNIKLKPQNISLDSIEIKTKITESDIDISELFAYIGSGVIKGNGRIVDYLKDSEVSMHIDLQDIDINDIKGNNLNLPFKVEGKIFGNINLKGNLSSTKNILSNLNAESYLYIKEGKILNANILKLVLDKISIIPGLSDKLYNKLPDKYKDKLSKKDTLIKKFNIDSRFKDDSIYFNNIEVEADGFIFSADGKMDLNGNLHINKTNLYIPKDLSSYMLSSVEDLRYFVNKEEQITIPFNEYSGSIAEVMLYPDIESITKTILKNRGKQELKNVIFKALDIDENQHPADNVSKQQYNDNGNNKKIEKNMQKEFINNVLDGLLEGSFK